MSFAVCGFSRFQFSLLKAAAARTSPPLFSVSSLVLILSAGRLRPSTAHRACWVTWPGWLWHYAAAASFHQRVSHHESPRCTRRHGADGGAVERTRGFTFFRQLVIFFFLLRWRVFAGIKEPRLKRKNVFFRLSSTYTRNDVIEHLFGWALNFIHTLSVQCISWAETCDGSIRSFCLSEQERLRSHCSLRWSRSLRSPGGASRRLRGGEGRGAMTRVPSNMDSNWCALAADQNQLLYQTSLQKILYQNYC